MGGVGVGVGVGWVMQGWGGVGHARVGWVGWGEVGHARGRVGVLWGHAGVGGGGVG